MARGVNKVILIGNLGSDPEVKQISAGSTVANVNLATNESWTDKSGSKQERTEWHRLVFWNKLAEIVGQYLKKGSTIYCEGRIQTRQWENKEGAKMYTTEINVSDMQMLDGRGDGGDGFQDRQESGGQPMSQQVPQSFGADDDVELPF
jgi:single-strand DNA-binding protein